MSDISRQAFFKERVQLYRVDIALFGREVLHFEPDPWHDAMFRDVVDHNRISVKSGQGVGKTAGLAIIVLWFLSCHPFPKIIATAPTMRQLNDVLWSEIAKWQSNSPLLENILRWTKSYVYMKGHEKRWFAAARTATKPENMQGFHEDNMLFVVDEASGIPEPIMEAILGTLSGPNNKLVLCGNPTKTSGTFYDSHTKDRGMWCCHTVNSEKSPRANKENIAAMKRKYGADSNFVRVRVYGEFPREEDDVFIPLSVIEKSVTDGKDVKVLEARTIDIGCDVARFGDDKTVIGFKINEKAEFFKKRHGQDTMRTAADIVLLGHQLIDKYRFKGKIPIKIDDGGVGGGVVDRLNQIKRSNPVKYDWMEIIPVKFGVRLKHRYYHDSTTYMMSIVKDLLQNVDDSGKSKPMELALPDDDDLVAQLSCRKYEMTEASRIKVESKEDMKDRDLPSPDEADCILLLCLPVNPKLRTRKGETNT